LAEVTALKRTFCYPPSDANPLGVQPFRPSAGTDPYFFGAIVDCSWGRIGSIGRCRRIAFADIDQAERFARKLSIKPS
jgi:hypothetical protein